MAVLEAVVLAAERPLVDGLTAEVVDDPVDDRRGVVGPLAYEVGVGQALAGAHPELVEVLDVVLDAQELLDLRLGSGDATAAAAQLAAEPIALLDDDRGQALVGGLDGGSRTGRAATDDDDVGLGVPHLDGARLEGPAADDGLDLGGIVVHDGREGLALFGLVGDGDADAGQRGCGGGAGDRGGGTLEEAATGGGLGHGTSSLRGLWEHPYGLPIVRRAGRLGNGPGSGRGSGVARAPAPGITSLPSVPLVEMQYGAVPPFPQDGGSNFLYRDVLAATSFARHPYRHP